MTTRVDIRSAAPRAAAPLLAAATCLALMGASTTALGAEGLPRETPSGPPPKAAAPVQHTLALNPVFIPFGTVTGEYERALLTRYTSAGMSAWYEYKDVRARWIYAKFMFYPWGRALHGLGVGLTAGIVRGYREPGDLATLAYDTAPIVGCIAQYNFFLGPHDIVLLGVGVGGRAVLKSDFESSPLRRFDGDARLVAGIAF